MHLNSQKEKHFNHLVVRLFFVCVFAGGLCVLFLLLCTALCLEFRIDYFVEFTFCVVEWMRPTKLFPYVQSHLCVAAASSSSFHAIQCENYSIELSDRAMSERWCKAIALCIRMTNSSAIWFNGSQLKRNTINHFLHMQTEHRGEMTTLQFIDNHQKLIDLCSQIVEHWLPLLHSNTPNAHYNQLPMCERKIIGLGGARLLWQRAFKSDAWLTPFIHFCAHDHYFVLIWCARLLLLLLFNLLCPLTRTLKPPNRKLKRILK